MYGAGLISLKKLWVRKSGPSPPLILQVLRTFNCWLALQKMRICKYTMVLFVYPIVSLRSKGFWWKKPGFSGCNRNVKTIWDMLVSPVQNLLELLQVRSLLYWVNSVNSNDSYSVTLPVPVHYWSRSRRLDCVK